MDDSGEKKRNGSDGTSFAEKVPQCLNGRFRTNAEAGNQVTRGHDHCKLLCLELYEVVA